MERGCLLSHRLNLRHWIIQFPSNRFRLARAHKWHYSNLSRQKWKNHRVSRLHSEYWNCRIYWRLRDDQKSNCLAIIAMESCKANRLAVWISNMISKWLAIEFMQIPQYPLNEIPAITFHWLRNGKNALNYELNDQRTHIRIASIDWHGFATDMAMARYFQNSILSASTAGNIIAHRTCFGRIVDAATLLKGHIINSGGQLDEWLTACAEVCAVRRIRKWHHGLFHKIFNPKVY